MQPHMVECSTQIALENIKEKGGSRLKIYFNRVCTWHVAKLSTHLSNNLKISQRTQILGKLFYIDNILY